MGENNKKFKGTYFISSISISTSIVEFGISSIFTLFLLDILHFSMPLASQTFAYYYGFAYLLPILIGYLSDKYLKRSTALTIGFISMIISQFILAFSASLYTPAHHIEYDTFFFNLQNTSFSIGLLFLALGTSFTTLSISNIINLINDENSKVDAFSLYYPILNLGVILGVLIMTLIIGDENFYMYKWAFLFLGIISIIGLIMFRLLKDKYLVDNEGNLMVDERPGLSITSKSNIIIHEKSSKSMNEIESFSLKEKLSHFRKSITPHEKDRIIVFFIFMLVILLYRIAYCQSNIAMVFFITTFVERKIGFYEVPIQLFFILNPLYIIILGPLYVKFNEKINEKNIKFGPLKRTIIGLLTISFCFIILSTLGYFLDINQLYKINMIWIIISELLIAISELFLTVAGYSLVGELAPKEYISLFYGIFTATRGVSMYVSGIISELYPGDIIPNFYHAIPVNGVMSYFLIFVVITIAAAAILVIFKPKIREKMHFENQINEAN